MKLQHPELVNRLLPFFEKLFAWGTRAALTM